MESLPVFDSSLHLQAVYEEDLIHRQAGAASTLNKQEESFPVTKKWIQEEKGSGPVGNSFTRIVIGELKAEILKDLGSAAGREQLCRYTLSSRACSCISVFLKVCRSSSCWVQTPREKLVPALYRGRL